MQVNDLVKVSAPGHPHEGRAGLVNSSEGGINAVCLDETSTEPKVVDHFVDDELTFLGR